MRWEIAGGNALGDHIDEGLARLLHWSTHRGKNGHNALALGHP